MLTLCVSIVNRYYFHFVTDGLDAFLVQLRADDVQRAVQGGETLFHRQLEVEQ